MKIDTKIWVLNQRLGPVVLQRTVGSEAFILDDNGIVSKTPDPCPSQITLPRIALLGENYTVVEWIDHQAMNLVRFAQRTRSGRSIVGTIHLIDLWIGAENGVQKCDFSLMFALADFDFSQFTPVPEYFGWTGITRDDGLPADPPPKSRYKRDWVI